MPRFNRLSLSLASTAAVALASLPLGITPASAAKVSEGTTSSIGVMETSPNAQQFNLKTQNSSSGLVAQSAAASGGRFPRVRAFLQHILECFGIQTTGNTTSPLIESGNIKPII